MAHYLLFSSCFLLSNHSLASSLINKFWLTQNCRHAQSCGSGLRLAGSDSREKPCPHLYSGPTLQKNKIQILPGKKPDPTLRKNLIRIRPKYPKLDPQLCTRIMIHNAIWTAIKVPFVLYRCLFV